MRAFIGQFDRVSAGVFLLGAAIGGIWLVALDLAVVLVAIALAVGSVVLVIRHRWIEIGLLMVGIGLVAQVGYAAFGAPPEPPPPAVHPGDPAPAYPSVSAELLAPGMAGLLLIGGIALTVVVGTWDMWEALRRERLDERHRRRRARASAGPHGG